MKKKKLDGSSLFQSITAHKKWVYVAGMRYQFIVYSE